eukprot:COSAG02_NODE_41907_length_389_cov_1.510345_1_plen_27_part_10
MSWQRTVVWRAKKAVSRVKADVPALDK